ncbi:MAG: fasciclin domain-containing protein, partial [Candidatus Poseidoniaceae archaeon]
MSADSSKNIPENVQATGVHDSLAAALAHADLITALSAEGPFTVFAPTDAAFTAAGIDLSTFDTDEENATLFDILTYHVYAGSVDAANVTDGMTATMFNGDDATFSVTDGNVMINDANVTSADVFASNGIIHVIDKVLMPPADLDDIPTIATNSGVHTALVAALSQAGLVST